jgi:hypothetical protein
MVKITKDDQLKALMHVKETYDTYSELCSDHRERLLKIYEEYRSFEQDKEADWSSTFKINKIHEIINKVLPRIIAKNPRWIVSLRSDEFNDKDKFLS